MCPYLFVCGFDLSVWYQKLFDMICLDATSFCIICSFFFFYPILFQFHPCFLCFSLSIAFFFLCSSKGFPTLENISLTLLPLFFFEEVDCYVASLCLQTCNNWCKPGWLPIQNLEPSCQSYQNFEKFLFAITFLSVLSKLLKLADCLKYSVSKFWIYRVFIG